MPAKHKNDWGKWVGLYDGAVADSRVAGAIAHACSLALWGEEPIQQEVLGDALDYVHEACARIAANLLKMDELRQAVGPRTAGKSK